MSIFLLKGPCHKNYFFIYHVLLGADLGVMSEISEKCLIFLKINFFQKLWGKPVSQKVVTGKENGSHILVTGKENGSQKWVPERKVSLKKWSPEEISGTNF